MGEMATCTCGSQTWEIVGNRIQCPTCERLIPKELGTDVRKINVYFRDIKTGLEEAKAEADANTKGCRSWPDSAEFGQSGG